MLKPWEFKHVYQNGKKFDGKFLAVFICKSDSEKQRVGITASKKAIGNAVKRNRVKRLLRETYRLKQHDFSELKNSYDVVINAKQALLNVKVFEPIAELSRILRKIKQFEKLEGERAS